MNLESAGEVSVFVMSGMIEVSWRCLMIRLMDSDLMKRSRFVIVDYFI